MCFRHAKNVLPGVGIAHAGRHGRFLYAYWPTHCVVFVIAYLDRELIEGGGAARVSATVRRVKALRPRARIARPTFTGRKPYAEGQGIGN